MADNAERDRLEAAVKNASAVLKNFPRNSVGLTSDEVKLSPEYKTAKQQYNLAFSLLRAFNSGKQARR